MLCTYRYNDISIPNRIFTITVKEADVRYIKCNAPSNYTHTVQNGLVARSEHDHQVPGYLVDFRECADERVKLRRGARAPRFRAPPVRHVARIPDHGVQAM